MLHDETKQSIQEAARRGLANFRRTDPEAIAARRLELHDEIDRLLSQAQGIAGTIQGGMAAEHYDARTDTTRAAWAIESMLEQAGDHLDELFSLTKAASARANADPE
jgi:hypothetical protein